MLWLQNSFGCSNSVMGFIYSVTRSFDIHPPSPSFETKTKKHAASIPLDSPLSTKLLHLLRQVPLLLGDLLPDFSDYGCDVVEVLEDLEYLHLGIYYCVQLVW